MDRSSARSSTSRPGWSTSSSVSSSSSRTRCSSFVVPGETVAVSAGDSQSGHHERLADRPDRRGGRRARRQSVGYRSGASGGRRSSRAPGSSTSGASVSTRPGLPARAWWHAVFLARWTAFHRAVMPALAATSRMPLRDHGAVERAGRLAWGTARWWRSASSPPLLPEGGPPGSAKDQPRRPSRSPGRRDRLAPAPPSQTEGVRVSGKFSSRLRRISRNAGRRRAAPIDPCADLAQGGTTPSILIRAIAASVEQADRAGGAATSSVMADDIAAIAWPRRLDVLGISARPKPVGHGSRRWLRASGQGARIVAAAGANEVHPRAQAPPARDDGGFGHGSAGDCRPLDMPRKGRPVRRG